MDAVPLSDAIKNLAFQAGRGYLLDSNLAWSLKRTGPSLRRQPFGWLMDRLAGRTPIQEPCVSLRWQNVTGFQALIALLENYDLRWIEDHHIGRISMKSESASMVELTPGARERSPYAKCQPGLCLIPPGQPLGRLTRPPRPHHCSLGKYPLRQRGGIVFPPRRPALAASLVHSASVALGDKHLSSVLESDEFLFSRGLPGADRSL